MARILAAFGITTQRLTEWDAIRAQVEASWKDQSISRDEAVALTGAQNAVARSGKQYIRKTIQIAGNCFSEEPATFDEFTKIPRPQQSLPKLIEALTRLTGLNTKYAAQLTPWGGGTLGTEGTQLLTQIKTADADQEKKLTGLPAKTEEYYFQKGRLFLAIKKINRAGKTAHLTDPLAAARYNLDILYRNAGRRTEEKPEDQKPAG